MLKRADLGRAVVSAAISVTQRVAESSTALECIMFSESVTKELSSLYFTLGWFVSRVFYQALMPEGILTHYLWKLGRRCSPGVTSVMSSSGRGESGSGIGIVGCKMDTIQRATVLFLELGQIVMACCSSADPGVLTDLGEALSCGDLDRLYVVDNVVVDGDDAVETDIANRLRAGASGTAFANFRGKGVRVLTYPTVRRYAASLARVFRYYNGLYASYQLPLPFDVDLDDASDDQLILRVMEIVDALEFGSCDGSVSLSEGFRTLGAFGQYMMACGIDMAKTAMEMRGGSGPATLEAKHLCLHDPGYVGDEAAALMHVLKVRVVLDRTLDNEFKQQLPPASLLIQGLTGSRSLKTIARCITLPMKARRASASVDVRVDHEESSRRASPVISINCRGEHCLLGQREMTSAGRAAADDFRAHFEDFLTLLKCDERIIARVLHGRDVVAFKTSANQVADFGLNRGEMGTLQCVVAGEDRRYCSDPFLRKRGTYNVLHSRKYLHASDDDLDRLLSDHAFDRGRYVMGLDDDELFGMQLFSFLEQRWLSMDDFQQTQARSCLTRAQTSLVFLVHLFSSLPGRADDLLWLRSDRTGDGSLCVVASSPSQLQFATLNHKLGASVQVNLRPIYRYPPRVVGVFMSLFCVGIKVVEPDNGYIWLHQLSNAETYRYVLCRGCKLFLGHEVLFNQMRHAMQRLATDGILPLQRIDYVKFGYSQHLSFDDVMMMHGHVTGRNRIERCLTMSEAHTEQTAIRFYETDAVYAEDYHRSALGLQIWFHVSDLEDGTELSGPLRRHDGGSTPLLPVVQVDGFAPDPFYVEPVKPSSQLDRVPVQIRGADSPEQQYADPDERVIFGTAVGAVGFEGDFSGDSRVGFQAAGATVSRVDGSGSEINVAIVREALEPILAPSVLVELDAVPCEDISELVGLLDDPDNDFVDEPTPMTTVALARGAVAIDCAVLREECVDMPQGNGVFVEYSVKERLRFAERPHGVLVSPGEVVVFNQPTVLFRLSLVLEGCNLVGYANDLMKQIYGPGAVYLNDVQEGGLLRVLQGQKDVLVVSGCGSGKSLLFLCGARASSRLGKCVLVVCPQKAVAVSCVGQCVKYGVSFFWAKGDAATISMIEEVRSVRGGLPFSLLLVTYDNLGASSAIQGLLRHLSVRGLVARYFIDEIQINLTQSGFRPCFGRVSSIASIVGSHVPGILMTATLATRAFQPMCNHLRIGEHERGVVEVRGRVGVAANVEIVVRQVHGPLQAVCDIMIDMIAAVPMRDACTSPGMLAGAGPMNRIMIVALTYDDANEIILLISRAFPRILCLNGGAGIDVLMASSDDAAMRRAIEGPSQIIICTTVLGMAVNVVGLRDVYIAGSAYTMCDVVQIMGRVGRTGGIGRAVFLFSKVVHEKRYGQLGTPKYVAKVVESMDWIVGEQYRSSVQIIHAYSTDGVRIFGESEKCRRVWIESAFEEVCTGLPCTASGHVRCDVCQGLLVAPPLRGKPVVSGGYGGRGGGSAGGRASGLHHR